MNRALHALLVGLAILISNPAAAGGGTDLAARVLRDATGLVPRSFSTRDFGREKYSGAVSVLVPEQDAENLVWRIRGHLPAGLVAFIGTRRSLTEPPAKGVEVVVGPGASQFDILRIAGSDATNYGKGTEDLVSILEEWDRRLGIDIYAAETDTIQLRIRSLPPDLTAFANEVYRFCPDIVDQGDGSVVRLAKEIRRTREVFLWWD